MRDWVKLVLISLGVTIFLLGFGYLNYTKHWILGYHQHDEICYWNMHNKYKICFDQRYDKWIIKDLDSSRVYGDSYYVNMTDNTTVIMMPYMPNVLRVLSPLFPTMFDDSCTAKSYLKWYIKKMKNGKKS